MPKQASIEMYTKPQA